MAVPELGLIDDALDGLDVRPVKRRQLNNVTELVKKVLARFDQRLDAGDARLTSGELRLTAVEDAGTALAGRVTTLEGANVLLLNVVASAGQLPASASVRQWYRVQGDTAVYVGNGAGNPLTKLTTSPLP